MHIKQLIYPALLFKSLILLFILLTFSNCTKKSPVEGFYKMKDKKAYAVVVENTLYIMPNTEQAFIFDLELLSKTDKKAAIVRKYNTIYTSSLNRKGHQPLTFPLKFKIPEKNGKKLVSTFVNNTFVEIGGYSFYRKEGNERHIIYSDWNDLLMNNEEAIKWRLRQIN